MNPFKNTTKDFVERTTITQFVSEHEAVAQLYVVVCNHHSRAFKLDPKGCVRLFNQAFLICYLAIQPDCTENWFPKNKMPRLRKIYYDSAFCLAVALLRIHEGLLSVPQHISNRLYLRCLQNELYQNMEWVIANYKGKLKKPINFSGAPQPSTESPAETLEKGIEMISDSFQQLEDNYQQRIEQLEQKNKQLEQKNAELEQKIAKLAEVERQLDEQHALNATEKEHYRAEIARLSQQLEEASKKRDDQADEWSKYPSRLFRHFDDENIRKAIMEAGKVCHGPQHFACLYMICHEHNCLNERNNKMLFARAIVALGLIMPSEGKGLNETAEQLRSGMTHFINKMQGSRKKLKPNTQKVIDDKMVQLEGIFKEYRLDGKHG